MNNPPSKIKAIETVYKGYRFRSRLEARWAVFFDTLGIEYRYEEEGYDLDGVRYLPDFWLPEKKYYIEIKGYRPSLVETEKCALLAEYAFDEWKETFLIYGQMPHPLHGQVENIIRYKTYIDIADEWHDEDRFCVEPQEGYKWAECPKCRKLGVAKFIGQLGCTCFRPNYINTFHQLCEYWPPKERGVHLKSMGLISGFTRYGPIPFGYRHTSLGILFKQCNVFLSRLQRGETKLFQWLDARYGIERLRQDMDLLEIQVAKMNYREECKNLDPCVYDTPRLIAAYTAARQARFEHGEGAQG